MRPNATLQDFYDDLAQRADQVEISRDHREPPELGALYQVRVYNTRGSYIGGSGPCRLEVAQNDAHQFARYLTTTWPRLEDIS